MYAIKALPELPLASLQGLVPDRADHSKHSQTQS